MLSYLAEVVCTQLSETLECGENTAGCVHGARQAYMRSCSMPCPSSLGFSWIRSRLTVSCKGSHVNTSQSPSGRYRVSLRGGTSKRWQKRTEQGSCARRWHARCLRRCREDACADRTLPSPASGASAPASTLTTSRCWFQIGFDRCLNTTHRGIEGWCAPWPVPPVPPVPL